MDEEYIVNEFVFPQRREHLISQPLESNRFWVQKVFNVGNMDEDNLVNALQLIAQTLCSIDKCQQILDNEIFDILYSVISNLEEVSLLVRKETLLILNNGLRNLLKLMDAQQVLTQQSYYEQRESLLSGISNLAHQRQDLNLFRNCLKAYVFLIVNFMSENSKIKESKEITSKVNKKLQRKNKTFSDVEKSALILKDIQDQKKKSLDYFNDIQELDIQFLWRNMKVEEDFVQAFIQVGFDMLLAQNKQKTKELKNKLFQIMQNCLKRFGDELKYIKSQNVTKIIDVIYTQEDLAQNMAELVGMIAEKQGSQISNEVVGELAKQIFDNNDTSGETLGIKNVSIFFRKLSKISAKSLYHNIGLLLRLFECESYVLRQAIIKILANIILFILSQDQEDPKIGEIYRITKDKFIDLLMKRFYDKSSYCRVKVIRVFKKLVISELSLIPKLKYSELLVLTISRIKDQTANVRKNALNLLAIIIEKFVKLFDIEKNPNKRFFTQQEIDFEKETIIKDLGQIQKKYDQAIIQEVQERERILKSKKNLITQDQILKALEEDPVYRQNKRKAMAYKDYIKTNNDILSFITEQETFAATINESLPYLIQVLSSKTQQDTIATIKVLTLLYKYGIQNSYSGIKKMLNLIFSKDEKVQLAVIESYRTLFLGNEIPIVDQTQNLLNLLDKATINEITCMEEIIKKFMMKNYLSSMIFEDLMSRLNSYAQINQLHSEDKQASKAFSEDFRRVLLLVRIIGQHNLSAINQNKNEIYSITLNVAQSQTPDFFIIKESITIYEAITMYIMQNNLQSEQNQDNFVPLLVKEIIKKFGSEDQEWFIAAESYLNMIFNLKSINGPRLMISFIQQLSQQIYEHGQSSAPKSRISKPRVKSWITDTHYSQLFFVVGHAAIKMLIYIDQQEEFIKQLGSEENKQGSSEQEQDELELICGGLEATIDGNIKELKRIQEENLIQDGLIGKYLPTLVKIATNTGLQKYPNDNTTISLLQKSAIFALCKIMCVSPHICQDNLGLLFQLLHSKIDSQIKGNIIISLGDQFQRFPNTFDTKIKDLFKLLQDDQPHVRRQTLLVLIHLILNDMIKLKGEIVDICMLLDDSNQKICDHVKLFLHEMFTKDSNSIYNLFSKALGRLSREFSNLSLKKFENIAINLLSYVQKDRQTEHLIDKIIQKLRHSTYPIEWRNATFCLTQIKLNEKGANKLLENIALFKEKFAQVPEMEGYIATIIQQAKKVPKNTQLKNSIIEMQNRLAEDEKMEDIEQTIIDLNNQQYVNPSDNQDELMMIDTTHRQQSNSSSNKKRSRTDFLNSSKGSRQQQQQQPGDPIAQRNLVKAKRIIDKKKQMQIERSAFQDSDDDDEEEKMNDDYQ